MIRFSDTTLNETLGNFNEVKRLMRTKTWMIATDATVVVMDEFESMASSFLLHLWDNGDVVIKGTDRPTVLGGMGVAPPRDLDIREIRNWCELNGWKRLVVDRLLVQEPLHFDYWMMQYRSGTIQCDELKKYDDAEMERMTQALKSEQQEE